jgi:hypothetical protein
MRVTECMQGRTWVLGRIGSKLLALHEIWNEFSSRFGLLGISDVRCHSIPCTFQLFVNGVAYG